MTVPGGITRVAAAAFIALALSSCAMNAQQQPGQAPPQKQSGQGRPATGGDTTIQQQLMGAEADPNLPGFTSRGMDALKVQWNYNSGEIAKPVLQFTGRDMASHGAQYLGWNDEGSLLAMDDGKVYVWNLKQNSLTVRYKGIDDVPSAVIAQLRNNPDKQEILASREPKQAPRPVAPVQVARNQGNIPDDAASNAIGRLTAGQAAQHASGTPGVYTATGATLKGDILTLTMTDGTRKAFKVERPAGLTGAASGGIAGTWVSFDANKIIVVQGDATATVTDMDARLRANFEQIKKLVGNQK